MEATWISYLSHNIYMTTKRQDNYICSPDKYYNNTTIIIIGDPAKSVDIALKIIDAVNYMHSHVPIVIHQDLKPQNVLVSITMI